LRKWLEYSVVVAKSYERREIDLGAKENDELEKFNLTERGRIRNDKAE
jgi:hypothetical protein